jgi:hypothetical protein
MSSGRSARIASPLKTRDVVRIARTSGAATHVSLTGAMSDGVRDNTVSPLATRPGSPAARTQLCEGAYRLPSQDRVLMATRGTIGFARVAPVGELSRRARVDRQVQRN